MLSKNWKKYKNWKNAYDTEDKYIDIPTLRRQSKELCIICNNNQTAYHGFNICSYCIRPSYSHRHKNAFNYYLRRDNNSMTIGNDWNQNRIIIMAKIVASRSILHKILKNKNLTYIILEYTYPIVKTNKKYIGYKFTEKFNNIMYPIPITNKINSRNAKMRIRKIIQINILKKFIPQLLITEIKLHKDVTQLIMSFMFID